jgi:hypothetical protein
MLASERASQARAELERVNTLRASRDGFVVVGGEVLGCVRPLARVTATQRFAVFDMRTGEGTVLEFATPAALVGLPVSNEDVIRRVLSWLRCDERAPPTNVIAEGDLPTDGSVVALKHLRLFRQIAAKYGRLPELDYAEVIDAN